MICSAAKYKQNLVMFPCKEKSSKLYGMCKTTRHNSSLSSKQAGPTMRGKARKQSTMHGCATG